MTAQERLADLIALIDKIKFHVANISDIRAEQLVLDLLTQSFASHPSHRTLSSLTEYVMYVRKSPKKKSQQTTVYLDGMYMLLTKFIKPHLQYKYTIRMYRLKTQTN